jgi:hypothetical protein
MPRLFALEANTFVTDRTIYFLCLCVFGSDNAFTFGLGAVPHKWIALQIFFIGKHLVSVYEVFFVMEKQFNLLRSSQDFASTKAIEFTDLTSCYIIGERFFNTLYVINMALSTGKFEIFFNEFRKLFPAHSAGGAFSSSRSLSNDFLGNIRYLSLKLDSDIIHTRSTFFCSVKQFFTKKFVIIYELFSSSMIILSLFTNKTMVV